jgi:DeoR/GlpR family transcriptional regulator of sugar metabolism
MANTLNVSESTIRNDLKTLEEKGRIKRVHGGAVLLEPAFVNQYSFKARYVQQLDEKRKIAVKAAEFVNDGDSILLDASSTVYCLACELHDRHALRIVTNGFEVAQEVAKNPSNNVILLGGVVNYYASSVTGLLSEHIIEDLFVQKAFISSSGFTLERGMTELHLNEAQLKRKMIKSAQQLYAIIDSSKFGKEDLTPIAAIDDIFQLITDEMVTSDWKEQLELAGIHTIISD